MSGTESIVVVVNSASTKGQADTAVLEKPLRIYIQKSQVIARYTIVYRQDFNYRPYERVISSSAFTCQEGAENTNPTCEWFYDNNGNKVKNSEGFCCSCDVWQIMGMSKTKSRSNDCTLNPGSSSAHCLRYDSLWYSAYEIMSNDLYYTIEVSIHEDGSGKLLSKLNLDPSKPIAADPNLCCVVKLIGDFLPSQPAPELNHLYLLMPSRPKTHAMVLEGRKNWMLINANLITFSGTECNKIGTSFTAFQTQGNKCEQDAGSCLENQIANLFAQDIQRVIENKTPQYLLAARGDFDMIKCTDDNIYLSYNMHGRQGTVITIEIPAEKIKFLTNVYILHF